MHGIPKGARDTFRPLAPLEKSTNTRRGQWPSARRTCGSCPWLANRRREASTSPSAGILTMPVDNLQLALAREAFAAFGKGRHPAALNFGDCFSYALATHFDVPLLCTGNGFVRTGLRVLPAAQQ